MQILDWLRARRRRLALLATIPLLAMVGALALSLGVEGRFRAQTVVEVRAPDADSPNAAYQAATRFARLVPSDEVLEATAETTGVDVERLRDGIGVTGDGATVTVLFRTARDAGEARDVVLAASDAALDALYRPSIDQAQRTIDEADARDLAAREAVNAFETTNGLVQDPEGYRRVLDPTRVVEYERLLAEVSRTSSALDRAERDLATLETRLGVEVAQLPATTDDGAAVSASSVILRRVLFAGAVGVVLAAVLAVVLELLLPPATPRHSEPRRDPDEVIESLRLLSGDRPAPSAAAAPPRRAVGGP